MGEKKHVTIPQAIQLINKAWGLEGEDYVKTATIYHAIWRGKIRNYGRRNKAMLDPEEVLKEYGPRSA